MLACSLAVLVIAGGIGALVGDVGAVVGSIGVFVGTTVVAVLVVPVIASGWPGRRGSFYWYVPWSISQTSLLVNVLRQVFGSEHQPMLLNSVNDPPCLSRADSLLDKRPAGTLISSTGRFS